MKTETDYIEYKNSDKFLSSRPEDKKDDWGKEIVGFANSNDGKIIIGINNDGTYEGYNIFAKFGNFNLHGLDTLKQKIENYCKDVIDPPIICTMTYKEESKGKVLIIDVPRKKEYPYAIKDGIKRTYYIRTSHGMIPIDDCSLISWLYKNTDDNSNYINIFTDITERKDY